MHPGGNGKNNASRETVEKVQMTNSGNFDLGENQLLTGPRILQQSENPGFSTVSEGVFG